MKRLPISISLGVPYIVDKDLFRQLRAELMWQRCDMIGEKTKSLSIISEWTLKEYHHITKKSGRASSFLFAVHPYVPSLLLTVTVRLASATEERGDKEVHETCEEVLFLQFVTHRRIKWGMVIFGSKCCFCCCCVFECLSLSRKTTLASSEITSYQGFRHLLATSLGFKTRYCGEQG